MVKRVGINPKETNDRKFLPNQILRVLIDEVHMLSSHSFNALLKTLEEPPPHVKFLLATTDPQKLPVTILSRCLQFSLKNMPPERVVEHLTHVLGVEQVPFEEDALWLLGRAADGSMRDAMSLTDQAIAFGEGKVLAADVRAMLGTLDHGQRLEMLQRALAELPPRCRESFLLRKIEGLSHPEIAEHLGISKALVEKHIVNAMKHCRLRIKQWDAH